MILFMFVCRMTERTRSPLNILGIGAKCLPIYTLTSFQPPFGGK